MDSIRLTADDRPLGDKSPIDRPSAAGNIPRERHRDGRRTAKSLLDDRVKVYQLIERCVRCRGTQFLVEFVLEFAALWSGQLPHKKAQSISCRVNPRGHVVFAFSRYLIVTQWRVPPIEAAEKTVAVWMLLRCDALDVRISLGRATRLDPAGEVWAECGEVVVKKVLCAGQYFVGLWLTNILCRLWW